ncbi:MAG: hypothetical protein AABW50_05465 [Nanoarchaeota archaeon]
MPELITLERKLETSPNIIAIVNWPEAKIPVRGYIFDVHIPEIYGSVERAAEHFIKRTNHELNKKNLPLFMLGFVKGKIWSEEYGFKKDRDILYLPFESSNGSFIKTNLFQVKDANVKADSKLGMGPYTGGDLNLWGDVIDIAYIEKKHWNESKLHGNPEEYFSQNIPEIPGIGYKEKATF